MPVDNKIQRQNVATNTVLLATKFVDSLYALQLLSDQRSKFVNPFIDSDFTGTANAQLDAAMLSTFFDFVLPSLQTNYIDQANAGRNKQIMLQMRG